MGDLDPLTAATRPTRRAILAGAGAAGLAGVLAACGGGESGEPAAGGSPAGSATNPPVSGSPGPASPTAAASPSAGAGEGIKTSDVPVGGGIVVENRGIVVTQPTAGTFKAFDATCTHQGCEVASVSSGKITCPCHGSQFNIADGSVARGPAHAPLAAKSVSVTGTKITVS